LEHLDARHLMKAAPPRPADPHGPTFPPSGLAEQRVEARARVLAAAYATHPERFVAGLPRPLALPTEVWINKPKAPLAEPQCDSEAEVVTNFAPRAPYSPAADSTHTQVSPRIGTRAPFGSVDSELHTAAVAPLNTEDLH